MIVGVFRRLFGTFREGALLHAKFVVVGTGTGVTFVLTSLTSGVNYKMTLVRTGVGLYTLTIPPVRNIAILGDGNILSPTAGLIGGNFSPTGSAAINSGAGTIALQSVSNSGATADTVTAGDQVHFTLYVDK